LIAVINYKLLSIGLTDPHKKFKDQIIRSSHERIMSKMPLIKCWGYSSRRDSCLWRLF